MSNTSRTSCGLDVLSAVDIESSIDELCKQGFDFMIVPIIHPFFKRHVLTGISAQRIAPLTRSDLLLTGQDWGSYIVAKFSPWLNMDSACLEERRNHERVLKQEIDYACHLGVPAVMISLNGPHNANLVRAINEHLISGFAHQYWVHVPLRSAFDSCHDVFVSGDKCDDDFARNKEENINGCTVSSFKDIMEFFDDSGYSKSTPKEAEAIKKHRDEIKFSQEFAAKQSVHAGKQFIDSILNGSNKNSHGDDVNMSEDHVSSNWNFRIVEQDNDAEESEKDDYRLKPLRINKGIECVHDTWTWWNSFRLQCGHHKKIGLVIEVTVDLPSSEELDRWLGEPIKAAILPTSLFVCNRVGFPVLSRAHQLFVRTLLKHEVQLVLSGPNHYGEKGYKIYRTYLEHLHKQASEAEDSVSSFAKGYEDFLQCPLQPLMDNLESQTYEVFEKDPVKYSQYQRAIYSCLLDKVEADKTADNFVMMILGAGRGPLVKATLKAAEQVGRTVKIYAIEKNPNAVVTLANRNEDEWNNQVTVVSKDMREWEPPELADVIISELLGSFGDNELSPECLDGAQRLLKEGGLSIPSSYTSYLAPIMSSRLWNEARLNKLEGKVVEAPFETPYVVRIRNVLLAGKPQPLFTFVHPNHGVKDNSRYEKLSFKIDTQIILHGFCGFFECVLYKDVTISINPETHSAGMLSWFSIYLPIKEPLQIISGSRLEVHFWRKSTEKNVWYEWLVTEPVVSSIHNPKGRSYMIGL